MNEFIRYMDRVLGSEGGYVNNPQDPGGETNWGIAKRSYPKVDIKRLTREQALAIYKRDFWDRLHADEIVPAFTFQLLDAAVNSGSDTAIRWMQRAAGVADDGHWGPATRAAVIATCPADLVLLFLAARLEFMTGLVKWPAFGKGWARRIAANLRFAAEDN